MRRKDREITDIKEIMNIIKGCQVCRLAMCDGARPYIVPMNFGVEQGGERVTLYVHCAKEGKKLDVLRENPSVCVEFDRGHKLLEGPIACAHSFAYESVIGEGRAEILTDPTEKGEGLASLHRHMTGKVFDFTPQQVECAEVLRITLDTVTGKRREE